MDIFWIPYIRILSKKIEEDIKYHLLASSYNEANNMATN